MHHMSGAEGAAHVMHFPLFVVGADVTAVATRPGR